MAMIFVQVSKITHIFYLFQSEHVYNYCMSPFPPYLTGYRSSVAHCHAAPIWVHVRCTVWVQLQHIPILAKLLIGTV
jgi:hypothetical protein